MLAVTAPQGQPAPAAAFIDRLEPGWLARAYAGDPSRISAVEAARRHLPDIALRYRTLLERLGPAFGGARRPPDADPRYFIPESTRQQSVPPAPAQAIPPPTPHPPAN